MFYHVSLLLVKNKCTFIVHCGPGGTNGQWMKIPGAGYNAGLGASAGSNTKGYGAGVPNRFGAKPGYGTGGYTVPINGYGAGLGYPNAGEPQQPIYSQGANLAAAGYVKGNSYPDLGHGVPTMNAKSGGGLQAPYNGAPAVPAALDGVGQPEQQPAGLGPNGKKGPVYGGMEGLLYGGPTGMGPEKSNAKYGIGGLQFGGSPQTGTNGGGYGVYEPTADLKSGKYGGANTGGGVPGQYGYGGLPNIGHLLSRGSNGHMAGKYGYGGMPHEVQPVGFVPQLQYPGAGQNGPGASPYQSGPLGFGPNVNYGGGDASYGPQGLVGEGKSAGKNVDNQGLHQSQPLESASERRSVGGDPTLSRAVDGEGMANNKYENVGYISGRKLQPEVISLPAAPTPVPMGSDDLRGAGGLSFDSADADQQSAARGSAQPDDPEQMPRQLHIQQRLKLHLHPQGSKNGKYDLNGFFGNSGYQG
ncbi:elastin-like isoform X3 [Phyllopteryx taeniolatus]|nr:elastin-like isoform X3 [Phyllopteryx taeniolatus]